MTEKEAAVSQSSQRPDVHRPLFENIAPILANCETSDPETWPMRRWTDKTNPERQFIQYGTELAPVYYTTRPTEPYLAQNWWDPEVAKKVVMIDRVQLKIYEDIARVKGKSQAFGLEGGPAIAKSFSVWSSSVFEGMPYDREGFSPGSKDTQIVGYPMKGLYRTLKIPLDVILDAKAGAFLDFRPEAREYRNFIIGQQNRGKEVEDYMLEVLGNMAGANLFNVSDVSHIWSRTMKMVKYGGMIAWEEPTTANPAIFESANELLETGKKRWSVPRYDGQALDIHPIFRIALCYNPQFYGEREGLTRPMLSRNEIIELPDLTKQRAVDIYRFFATGQHPKFKEHGIEYQAPPVESDYMVLLQTIPNLEAVIDQFATFHMAYLKLVESQIGQNPMMGGKYLADMRTITQVLDSIVRSANAWTVEAGGKTLTRESSWEVILKKALYEAYMMGAQTGPDQALLKSKIDSLPIWAELRDGKATIPAWALGGSANTTVIMEGSSSRVRVR